MSQYVSPGVAQMRDEPSMDDTVRLAIVPEGETSEVEAIVREVGGTVERTLPSGIVIATVEEVQLEQLCSTDGFASISLTDRMRTLHEQ